MSSLCLHRTQGRWRLGSLEKRKCDVNMVRRINIKRKMMSQAETKISQRSTNIWLSQMDAEEGGQGNQTNLKRARSKN